MGTPPSAEPRRRAGPGIALGLVVLALLAAPAPRLLAQGEQGPPSIQQLERLAAEREARISTLESRLRTLEAEQDSLVAAKRRAEPGGARFEAVSNQILEKSNEIRPLKRDLRIQREQLRDLKTTLYLRYNTLISQTNQRIKELTDQGLTSQTSPELRGLIERQVRYVRERETLSAEIEQVQGELYLPDLVFDPNDGPRELQSKEAQARDAVESIDGEIADIEKRIDALNRSLRMRQEAERLRRDIELWGDDQAARSANEIAAMLEQPAPGGIGDSGANPFQEDPRVRIRRLQSRRLELVDLRADYARKAEQFAQRLKEFYR